MQAYTYSIYHKASGRYYYGVRKASAFDLGTVYFSSSKLVKRMLLEDGPNAFIFKLRRKFDTYPAARKHETKFLQRVRAVANPKMLNQAISSSRVPSKDSVSEERRKKAISTTMRQLWSDDSFRATSRPTLSSEEASRRSKLRTPKQISGYETGRRIRRGRKSIYKDVEIHRNGIIKTIKANQVPAYRKIGWERLTPTSTWLVGWFYLTCVPVEWTQQKRLS